MRNKLWQGLANDQQERTSCNGMAMTAQTSDRCQQRSW